MKSSIAPVLLLSAAFILIVSANAAEETEKHQPWRPEPASNQNRRIIRSLREILETTRRIDRRLANSVHSNQQSRAAEVEPEYVKLLEPLAELELDRSNWEWEQPNNAIINLLERIRDTLRDIERRLISAAGSLSRPTTESSSSSESSSTASELADK